MRWLVTGSAGFVGFHLTRTLLDDGHDVVGVDNLTPYYSPGLKRARLEQLDGRDRWRSVEMDIRDPDGLRAVWRDVAPDVVVHLAAQTGVRHAHEAPMEYVTTNVVGFANVLECARHEGTGHLVYASSSSVYGALARLPYSTHDAVAHPVSLYAATKRSDELLSHAYSHMYGLPATGLRFFTVYGPWGRPDMAYFIFAKRILDGEPLEVFGDGSAIRDFIFVDDIVEGIVRVGHRTPTGDPGWDAQAPDPGSSSAPWRLYNIGHGGRHSVRELITTLEELLDREADVVYGERVAGDVAQTEAETADLEQAIGFRPKVDFRDGLQRFCDWYVDARARFDI